MICHLLLTPSMSICKATRSKVRNIPTPVKIDNRRAENFVGSLMRIGVRIIELVVRSSLIKNPSVTRILRPKKANMMFCLENLLRSVGEMRQPNFKKIIEIIVIMTTSQ